MNVELERTFRFEAAHLLPHHPGKCRELHGHGYCLVVTVDLPVDPTSGMAIDFSDLKQVVRQRVVSRLDHKYVNDVIDNPTAERMAQWIWEQLAGALEGLEEIELHETYPPRG